MSGSAIWWIRRDLRLADNLALAIARRHSEVVVPVFILDPVLLASPYVGEKRLAFLWAGLRTLTGELRARGSRLTIRRGRPLEALSRLQAEVGADAIVAEDDVSPYARRRDAAIAAALPLHLTAGVTVHPPGAVLKADRAPYTVFTPFSKAWKQLPPATLGDLLSAPERIATPHDLASLPVPEAPSLPASVPFVAGEAEAHRRLAAFVTGHDAPVYRYADGRNRLDVDGTAQLSPYLRFGMLSARQAVVAARTAIAAAPDVMARRGAEAWLGELIWREFYAHLLYHYPQVRQGSLRAAYDRIRWRNDATEFQAWCLGQTGYPVVDAAMRQLAQTGWLHNRARMIVASFLTKDLLIDWRWGDRWFMQHLVDGDPASNNGGWQWTAGTGTDAAPYFRVFNPTLQGMKFDPDGAFVRHWLPELRQVPTGYIHSPAQMPAAEQESSGCVIGRDYPAPIVEHGEARKRTLAVYGEALHKAP